MENKLLELDLPMMFFKLKDFNVSCGFMSELDEMVLVFLSNW